MIRDGRAYIKAIAASASRVYYDGKIVEDIVSHPVFKPNIMAAASYYDLHSKNQSLRVNNSDVGEETAVSFLKPKDKESLKLVRRGLEIVQDNFYGYFSRSPDYFNVLTMLFAAHSEDYFSTSFGTEYAHNVQNIYKEAAKADSYYTLGVVSPIYDRATQPSTWKDGYIQLGVVKEERDGVTVRGAVMVSTSSPCSEMLWYLPSIKVDSDPKYSIGFSIPSNTKGISFISRRSFRPREGMGSFEYPITSRFDDSDASIVFDNVFIPKERLIIYKSPNQMEGLKESIVKYRTWYNWHALIQIQSKLKFFAGLGISVAESLGVDNFINVQEKLGEILMNLAMCEGMITAAEEKGEQLEQIFRPNSYLVISGANFFMNAMPRVYEILRSIAGGSALPIPATMRDFKNNNEYEYLEEYFSIKNVDVIEKAKLFNILWDVIGSELGVRYEQYDRFSRGDPTLRSAQTYTSVFKDKKEEYRRLVKGIMDEMPDPRK